MQNGAALTCFCLIVSGDEARQILTQKPLTQRALVVVSPVSLYLSPKSDADTTSGFYNDQLAFCSTACPCAAQTLATQNQTVTLNGRTYPLVLNSFVYSCSKNTINGKS